MGCFLFICLHCTEKYSGTNFANKQVYYIVNIIVEMAESVNFTRGNTMSVKFKKVLSIFCSLLDHLFAIQRGEIRRFGYGLYYYGRSSLFY